MGDDELPCESLFGGLHAPFKSDNRRIVLPLLGVSPCVNRAHFEESNTRELSLLTIVGSDGGSNLMDIELLSFIEHYYVDSG